MDESRKTGLRFRKKVGCFNNTTGKFQIIIIEIERREKLNGINLKITHMLTH